jgi:putative transposase
MLDTTYSDLSVRHQARLLGVYRSKIYYNPVPIINDDSNLANLVAESYGRSGCRYGYRKVHADLIKMGHNINKKKVLKMMQKLNFKGLYPKKKCNTTVPNKDHKVYPYLLTEVKIIKVNQVWATDITYIWIQDRFMYFIAIIDIYSRYIVEYGLSHSLEGEFYVLILSQALKKGQPEIFNTDQGSQFTSNEFTALLIRYGIRISMDHKGRCFDNIYVERLWRTVKQEAIYYYRPENIAELEKVLNEFVVWYNNERNHQSLQYKKPAQVYYDMN